MATGFDSFWACNEGAAGQRAGFNGVATFAWLGLTLRADSLPLASAELDGEARCLLTDHGAFVLFNVYVPNSAGRRLPFKLRWLSALRAALQRALERGKRVILAGDLNLRHRPRDAHWSWRLVDLRALQGLAGGNEAAVAAELRAAVAEAVAAWPRLRAISGLANP